MNGRHGLAAAVFVLLFMTVANAEGTPKSKVHVYLLLGQSNMAGRGKVEPQDREMHPRVFMLTKEGTWVPASEPVQFDR
ncbi:MAG TPA: sialate O-acetylesterase, partial [Planctomycetota bacterium]|nr:sialate O-acetylesterase [Planctomycetota bacterium]